MIRREARSKEQGAGSKKQLSKTRFTLYALRFPLPAPVFTINKGRTKVWLLADIVERGGVPRQAIGPNVASPVVLPFKPLLAVPF